MVVCAYRRDVHVVISVAIQAGQGEGVRGGNHCGASSECESHGAVLDGPSGGGVLFVPLNDGSGGGDGSCNKVFYSRAGGDKVDCHIVQGDIPGRTGTVCADGDVFARASVGVEVYRVLIPSSGVAHIHRPNRLEGADVGGVSHYAHEKRGVVGCRGGLCPK